MTRLGERVSQSLNYATVIQRVCQGQMSTVIDEVEAPQLSITGRADLLPSSMDWKTRFRRSPVLILLAMSIAMAGSSCGSEESRTSAGVLISEFMAANESTLRDEDGDFSDWIELYNRGEETIDLEGWALSDRAHEPQKWRIPAVTLSPGEHLLVFASGKNRREPESELHTSFRLARDGEFLALTTADGVLASSFGPGYPPQIQDRSYGVSMRAEPEADTSEVHPVLGETVFLERSTPGLPNPKTGWKESARAPRVLTQRSFFTGSLAVQLEAPGPGTTVRFTLDGSTPDDASSAYGSPIELTGVAHLRARSFAPDLAPSEVIRKTIVSIDDDLLGFDSDLPLVLISTPADDLSGELAPMHIQVIEPGADGRSSITASRAFVGAGGIRRRGSSSYREPKQSYAIELQDARGGGEAVPLLDMPSDSDWVLYGPYNFDRALMRNALMYELSNRIGRYAPRTRFCELFLHRGAGKLSERDYLGVYSLVEKIKRGPHRVDVDEPAPDHSTVPLLTGGFILKLDRPDPGDEGFEAAGVRVFFVYPKEKAIMPPQRAWLQHHFNAFGAALRGPEFRDAVRGYASFIDVDSWIDHHLLNQLAKNPDGTRLSLYFSKRRGGKIVMGPIWDFDRALGSEHRSLDPVGWAPDRLIRWWGRLFEDAAFRARYDRRWRELRVKQLSTPGLHAVVDALAAEIREAQARNFARWPEADPGPNGWQVGQVERLKTWLAVRAAWMDGELIPGSLAGC